MNAWRLIFLLLFMLIAGELQASPILLVSEYGSGNIRAFDSADGSPVSLPSHYAPVGGNSSGADGMVQDADGRLLVNRGDGTIYRRSVDGATFDVFVNIGVSYLLDLTRNDTHLFAAQYGENVIHQIALSNAAIITINGPSGTDRFDGVRIGPDGRLYAVESADGGIYAFDLANQTWSTFLHPDNAGDASQLEFGADGRVFLSRTIGGQARIYSYELYSPGDYSSGLNTNSRVTIGTFGNTAATGIRIGPDNRLYANAFNAGEVWRSGIGITNMEATAFVSGLNEPGSLYFENTGSASNHPPSATNVVVVGAPIAGRNLMVYYTYSDPENDPEGETIVRWYFDQPPFTNIYAGYVWGTNRYTVLPYNPGPWYVRAAVIPHAANGVITGEFAYSEWKGPILAESARSVFHVGDSFTRWGDIPRQIQNLAMDAGKDHIFGEQLTDGVGLGHHWTNGLYEGIFARGTPSRLELATGGWDWLVLQPMSREWMPSNTAGLLEFTTRFAALAQSNNTRVALYHYWNYLDEGPSVQNDINASFHDLLASLASNGINAVIIPVGVSFTNAASVIAGLNREDLYQDNIHPGDEGCYLSALMHYATLYRQSPAGLTNAAISSDADSGDAILIDPALAAALQQVAWDTARYDPHSGVTRGRYDEWADDLPPHQRDWGYDLDTNGIPNLLRWAYGFTSPTTDEPDRFLRGEMVDGNAVFRYTVGEDAEDAGVRIEMQWSTSLVPWNTIVPEELVISRTNQEVWISSPYSETNGFLRLRISIP